MIKGRFRKRFDRSEGLSRHGKPDRFDNLFLQRLFFVLILTRAVEICRVYVPLSPSSVKAVEDYPARQLSPKVITVGVTAYRRER